MSRWNSNVIFFSALLWLLTSEHSENMMQARMTRTFAKAMHLVKENYLEEVKERDLFEGAMDGMMARLDDVNSAYMPPQETAVMEEDLNLKFGGIGIEVVEDRESGFIKVASPIFNTPAYHAGLRAGDLIVAVDGKSVEKVKYNELVGLLRGDVGDSVRVSILHQGETKAVDYDIVRAEIQIDSVLGDTRNADGRWNYFLSESPEIGYVRVTSFGDGTEIDLEEVLTEQLEAGMKGLLLDLRGNPGGYLDAGVKMCDLFISQGVIVKTKDRMKKDIEVFLAKRPGTLADFPMVVLIDGGSASASEIVAACLQDHGRAVIVGDRSYGKGTVQHLIPLEGGKSRLRLTSSSYWRPSEKNIHRGRNAKPEDVWGVSPDAGCEVKMDEKQLETLFRTRRERDIRLVDGLKKDAGTKDAADKNGSKPLPPLLEVDPQLKKGLDVLREKLNSK